MSKEDIIEKLNKNRMIKLPKKVKDPFIIEATFRLAKKGSTHHYEKVAVLSNEGDYFWKPYTQSLPQKLQPCKEMTLEEAKCVLSVIKDYDSYKGYYLNPYTWLVTGCLYKGLDLVDKGFITP